MQKTRIRKLSAIFKNSKMTFVLEVILFLWTKGFWTHLCICANANAFILERTHERGNRLYMFYVLCMVCLGSPVSSNRQNCNRQSMQRVQNTWSIGTGLCLNAPQVRRNEGALLGHCPLPFETVGNRGTRAITCIQWQIQTRRLGGQSNWGAPKRFSLAYIAKVVCDNRCVSHIRGYIL